MSKEDGPGRVGEFRVFYGLTGEFEDIFIPPTEHAPPRHEGRGNGVGGEKRQRRQRPDSRERRQRPDSQERGHVPQIPLPGTAPDNVEDISALDALCLAYRRYRAYLERCYERDAGTLRVPPLHLCFLFNNDPEHVGFGAILKGGELLSQHGYCVYLGVRDAGEQWMMLGRLLVERARRGGLETGEKWYRDWRSINGIETGEKCWHALMRRGQQEDRVVAGGAGSSGPRVTDAPRLDGMAEGGAAGEWKIVSYNTSERFRDWINSSERFRDQGGGDRRGLERPDEQGFRRWLTANNADIDDMDFRFQEPGGYEGIQHIWADSENRKNRHRPRRQDSRERSRRVDSRERNRRADSRERNRRVDSRERNRRVDSRERNRRVDSRERNRRVDSRERNRRVDSRERSRRVDSRERNRRVDSRERNRPLSFDGWTPLQMLILCRLDQVNEREFAEIFYHMDEAEARSPALLLRMLRRMGTQWAQHDDDDNREITMFRNFISEKSPLKAWRAFLETRPSAANDVRFAASDERDEATAAQTQKPSDVTAAHDRTLLTLRRHFCHRPQDLDVLDKDVHNVYGHSRYGCAGWSSFLKTTKPELLRLLEANLRSDAEGKGNDVGNNAFLDRLLAFVAAIARGDGEIPPGVLSQRVNPDGYVRTMTFNEDSDGYGVRVDGYGDGFYGEPIIDSTGVVQPQRHLGAILGGLRDRVGSAEAADLVQERHFSLLVEVYKNLAEREKKPARSCLLGQEIRLTKRNFPDYLTRNLPDHLIEKNFRGRMANAKKNGERKISVADMVRSDMGVVRELFRMLFVFKCWPSAQKQMEKRFARNLTYVAVEEELKLAWFEEEEVRPKDVVPEYEFEEQRVRGRIRSFHEQRVRSVSEDDIDDSLYEQRGRSFPAGLQLVIDDNSRGLTLTKVKSVEVPPPEFLFLMAEQVQMADIVALRTAGVFGGAGARADV